MDECLAVGDENIERWSWPKLLSGQIGMYKLKLSKNSCSFPLARSKSAPSILQFKSPAMRMGLDVTKRIRWYWKSKQLKSTDKWFAAWRGSLKTAHRTNLRPRFHVKDIYSVPNPHMLQVHTDWSLLTLKSALLRTATFSYPLPSSWSALVYL